MATENRLDALNGGMLRARLRDRLYQKLGALMGLGALPYAGWQSLSGTGDCQPGARLCYFPFLTAALLLALGGLAWFHWLWNYSELLISPSGITWVSFTWRKHLPWRAVISLEVLTSADGQDDFRVSSASSRVVITPDLYWDVKSIQVYQLLSRYLPPYATISDPAGRYFTPDTAVHN